MEFPLFLLHLYSSHVSGLPQYILSFIKVVSKRPNYQRFPKLKMLSNSEKNYPESA